MTDRIFSANIVEWYQEHHRTLPWRRTRDPYRIWLSEIILQQTRVIQGLPYYLAFVKKYPRIQQLAQAPEKEILRLWQGLGYYSRARNLHACAKTVCTNYAGKFPASFEKLRELKGIGNYTAAAIASMAFRERVAVVDGNVFRVLARVFGLDDDITSTAGKKVFWELANRLVPAEGPGTYNQAIMEFGALHCTPRNPRCEDCPFQQGCYAFRTGSQDRLPVKKKARQPVKRFLIYVVVRSGQRWLLKERTGKDIWAGLYDFPLLERKSRARSSTIVSEVARAARLNRKMASQITMTREHKHVLSHQLIYARFLELDLPKNKIPNTAFFRHARLFTTNQLKALPKSVLISGYLRRRSVL